VASHLDEVPAPLLLHGLPEWHNPKRKIISDTSIKFWIIGKLIISFISGIKLTPSSILLDTFLLAEFPILFDFFAFHSNPESNRELAN